MAASGRGSDRALLTDWSDRRTIIPRRSGGRRRAFAAVRCRAPGCNRKPVRPSDRPRRHHPSAPRQHPLPDPVMMIESRPAAW